ncbi:hypothetical protein [Clostridium botulinum]|uniref:hypothetical protein n=1 Tax=Clostridium botulinum TaxID=1491 RepID=UPI0004D881A7|nr:hypothetical protein [Clostridium botulinum]KEH90463.1 hypothetical protein Z963_p0017 [Clostridium botulinum C/D str. It1]
MANIAKVRELLKTLICHLNDEEISDIGKILLRATERLAKELEEKNGQANKEI